MTDANAAVGQAADELYGLTLERFTDRRNELAKSLRKQGDRSAADAVKALRKPNQTAWALNQVARRRAEDVERLLEVGAELRHAQEAVLSGDDPRSLTAASKEVRRVVSDLVTAAAAIAGECGVGATDSLRERVRSTLEAAVRDADVGETLRAGRLVGDHRAVGLLGPSGWPSPEGSIRREGSLEKSDASDGRREPKVKSDGPAGPKRVDARKAAHERREAERAKRVEESKQRLEAAQQIRASAEERLEGATGTATEARERAEQASAEAERAEKARGARKDELDEAQAQVRNLEKELKRAERAKA